MAKPVVLYNSGKLEGLSGITSGQVLTWNGTEWTPGTNNGGSGGGGAVYYMNNSTAAEAPTGDIPTSPVSPKQLGLSANASQTTVTSAALSTSIYDLVCGFVTDVGVPATTVIPTGLWDFNVWASSTGTYTNQTIFQIRVYKFDNVTQQLSLVLATSDDVYMYDPGNSTQYIVSVLMPQTALLTTDRIYVELRGKAATSGKTITFYFGDGTPTHVHTNLSGITGTGLVHVINGVIQTTATAVNLAGGSNEVTGTLPLANVAGPTGVGFGYTSATGVWNAAALTGTDKLVGFSGSTPSAVTASTGLSLSGGNLTLATVGAAAGPTGSATTVPVVTIDVYGRVTALTSAPISIPASSVSSIPYDIASMVVGNTLASPSNVVMYFTATRAFTISTDTAKHYFKAVTAATSSTAFIVKRGANTVFTATFAPAGTTASIGAIDTNYNAFSSGDVLTIEAPATPDATLSDIYWTINAVVA